VRLSTESVAKRTIALGQLRSAVFNGCAVSGYIWGYWDLKPVSHVHDAIGILGLNDFTPDKVKTIWIDAEDPASGDVAHWLRTAINEIRALGYQPGIYTGIWWIKDHLNDLSVLEGVRLWLAEYNNIADLDSVELIESLKRAQLVGHQYSADGIDLDVFDSRVA
jgi:hypothetical protein